MSEDDPTCRTCEEKVPALFWDGSCVHCVMKAVAMMAKGDE